MSKKESYRTIARIKEEQGRNGAFRKVLINNPFPTNKDGSVNKYHTGILLWCDGATGKHYLVKQMKVGSVSDSQHNVGFTESLYIDLEDEYNVTDLSEK